MYLLGDDEAGFLRSQLSGVVTVKLVAESLGGEAQLELDPGLDVLICTDVQAARVLSALPELPQCPICAFYPSIDEILKSNCLGDWNSIAGRLEGRFQRILLTSTKGMSDLPNPAKTSIYCAAVDDGVSGARYFPRKRQGGVNLVVTFDLGRFIDEESTLALIGRLHSSYASKVAFRVIGFKGEFAARLATIADVDFFDRGLLKVKFLPELLGLTDIVVAIGAAHDVFCAPLEVMASGCVAIFLDPTPIDEDRCDTLLDYCWAESDTDLYAKVVSAIEMDSESRRTSLRRGQERAAERSIERRVFALEEAFHNALASVPVSATVSRAPKRIALVPQLMDDGRPNGCAHIRLLYPFGHTPDAKVWKSTRVMGALPAIGSADIAYIQRDMQGYVLDEIVGWAVLWKNAGGKIVYDVDDDLINISDLAKRVGGWDRASVISHRTRVLLNVADRVTVSTSPLRDVLSRLHPDVVVVPNMVDVDLWGLREGATHVSRARAGSRDFVIGYFGTPTHNADLALVREAVLSIRQAFPCVRFEVIGAFQNIDPPFGEKVWLPHDTEYPAFVGWLRKRALWDLVLIPLVDDRFNRSKSNIKFLESAALGLPIVCSNVESYRTIARDGQNCLLVNNDSASWVSALRALIANDELRCRLAVQARKDVIDGYALDANRKELFENVFGLFPNHSD